MKLAVITLILGVMLLQGEALKCYQASCPTYPGNCHISIETCPEHKNTCYSVLHSKMFSLRYSLNKGCTTKADCKPMKTDDTFIQCCCTDLCN
ncbi:muscarinic toxin-like protein Tx-NM3-2 [Hyperolius riggenbachi]|uniref:muscarinic toxin-like protein Tx-NM3-2 n=1 Tax=Hyperolius riggenbachi TaxID=752182 RepID=UPI0035A3147B